MTTKFGASTALRLSVSVPIYARAHVNNNHWTSGALLGRRSS